MQRSGVNTLVIGLLCGLATGFVVANLIYRANYESSFPQASKLNQTTIDGSGTKPNSASQPFGAQLTSDELRQAVIRADLNKDNLELQRNLGLALFRYAALENKQELLPDVVRLLQRAETKTTVSDQELFQTLGDALFVLARADASPEKMLQARESYRKALKNNSRNADLYLSIGQTYFYADPPDPAAALQEYVQALKFKHNDEKGLESLTSAQIALDKLLEAEQSLKALRQVNPQNKAADDLQGQILQRQLKGKGK